MEGFDTMPMPYLADPLSVYTMRNPDYLNTVPTEDMQEHRQGYSDVFAGYSTLSSGLYPRVLSNQSPPDESPALTDHSLLDSGDDVGFAPLPMSLHPIRQLSSNQFEDPFTDITSFEALPTEHAQADFSIDHNHKLLDFSVPTYNFTLLDHSLRQTSLSLNAQLHGMFFLAESLWASSPNPELAVPPLAELTCYRRNLFQVTGSVTLPRKLGFIMTDQGDRFPILAQELTVSATESVESNHVKLISVPSKTPAANATGSSEDKTEEPLAMPLDSAVGKEMNSDFATFPIAWKRLQFRVATANNGRRKELQQRFVVRLKVIATLSTGAKVSICEAHSGPVIVRGRSPRNFQSRKDLPLNRSPSASRKNTRVVAPLSLKRRASDAAASQQVAPRKRSKSPQEKVGPEQQPLQLQLQQPQPSLYHEWTQLPEPTSIALPTPNFATSTISVAAIPVYAHSSSEISSPPQKRRRNSTTAATDAPESLSLENNGSNLPDSMPNTNYADQAASIQFPFTTANHTRVNSETTTSSKVETTPPIMALPDPVQENHTGSGSVNLLAEPCQHLAPPSPIPVNMNPSESADPLYEYFPLNLDGLQPPVNAVYRPYFVRHMYMPEAPKLVATARGSKTYFAGDDT